MMKIPKLLSSLLLISTLSEIATGKDISRAFEKNDLVPYILDHGPVSRLSIKYCSNEVKPGEKFTPEETKKQPEVGAWCGESNKYYSLIMFDPDAPSRANPTLRSVLHWFVANIPGNRISRGDVLVEYEGPAPPKDTGFHRYVTVIFEQLNGKVQYPTSYYESQVGFSVKDAVKKFNLSRRPVAGNFFQAKY